MYTVDYFINQFSSIPESLWIDCVIESDGARCALGHCGCNRDTDITDNPKSSALAEILQPLAPNEKDPFWLIVDINDGHNPAYQQLTPKKRMLAALHDIKAMQEKEQKTERIKTVYVSVPETVKEQSEELIMN